MGQHSTWGWIIPLYGNRPTTNDLLLRNAVDRAADSVGTTVKHLRVDQMCCSTYGCPDIRVAVELLNRRDIVVVLRREMAENTGVVCLAISGTLR